MKKSARVAKGHVPILVGDGEEIERFTLSLKLFKHPRIVHLLEMAAKEFGFEQKGVLRIPCDVQYFRRVLKSILED